MHDPLHKLGHTRSARERDHFLLTPDTFVRAPLPGMRGATAIVHVAPAGGARFTQYTVEFEAGGTLPPSPAQRFIYVLEGALSEPRQLASGQFLYIPPGEDVDIVAAGPSRVAIVEVPRIAHRPCPPCSRATKPPARASLSRRRRTRGADAAARIDPAFDFAVNTMTYQPGASLPMVEIHVMEHGLLMLEGGGIYRLGDHWYPVAAGDFIWMAPYCPQWFGALGKTPGEISHLQGLEPPSAGDQMTLDVDAPRSTHARTGDARRRSPTPPRPRSRASSSPRPTCSARACVKQLCAERRPQRPRGRRRQHLRPLGQGVGSRSCPPSRTGSHIDAIPNAGRYDGTVGVLGGLEAIRALQRAGFRPRRSIELLLFTSEEPTRFGIGCLGSRLLAGALDPARAADSCATGKATPSTKSAPPPDSTARSPPCALPPATIAGVRRAAHRAGSAAGARAAFRSASSPPSPRPPALRIEIEGEGGHAGAVLMPDRHDAFLRRRRNRAGGRSRRRSRPAPSTPWRPSASATSFPEPSTASPAASVLGSTSATSTWRAATACWRPSSKPAQDVAPAPRRSHAHRSV